MNSIAREALGAAQVADTRVAILPTIYDQDTNLVIWSRELTPAVREYSQALCQTHQNFRCRLVTTLHSFTVKLPALLPEAEGRQEFHEDVIQVIDMFSCLFDLNHVGLRLAVLSTAMCPNFHVDRVPCRLVSTYFGRGSEWLPEHCVRRGADGQISTTGLATWPPECLNEGDVALLKGEAWEGNEGRGLVHRSPEASSAQPRLVLTLDLA